MKVIIKLEFILIVLVASVFFYNTYSYNSFNILMKDSVEIEYNYNNEMPNKEVINELSKFANESNIDLYNYYQNNGHYLYKYNVNSDYYETNNQKDGKRNINLPNTWENIIVQSIEKQNEYPLNYGTLLVEGKSQDIEKFKTKLSKNNIKNIDRGEITPNHGSEVFGKHYFAAMSVMLVLLASTIATEITLKRKKINIMFFEGYTYREILAENIRGKAKWLTIIFSCGFVITNVYMLYHQYNQFLILYLLILILTFVLSLITIIGTNILLIRKFNIENLKNAVTIKHNLYLLYLLKCIVIIIVLYTTYGAYNMYLNYQEVIKQEQYQELIKDYYGYTYRGSGEDLGDPDHMNQKYHDFYIKTQNNSNGILVYKTSSEEEFDTPSKNLDNIEVNLIVSPNYASKLTGKTYQMNDNKIRILLPTGTDLSTADAKENFGIDFNDNVEIEYIQPQNTLYLNSHELVVKSKYNAIIIANKGFLSEEQAKSNMRTYMQSYYLDFSTKEKKAEIKSIIKDVQLNSSITTFYSLSQKIDNQIHNLKQGMKKNLQIITITIVILLLLIYLINKMYNLLVSKKQAILMLEGYSIFSIYKEKMLFNTVAYMFAIYIVATYQSHPGQELEVMLVSIPFIIIDFTIEYLLLRKNKVNTHKILKGEND